jgi:hypothetical protein
MLKSLISLCFLIFMLAATASKISAQDGYESGKPYSFSGLNADGSKLVTLSITFDLGGAATISRAEKAATKDDIYSFFYFINSGSFEYLAVNDDGLAQFSGVAANPKEYYFINFDTPKAVKYSGKVGAELIAVIGCNWAGDKSRECATLYKGTALKGQISCVLGDDGQGCKMSVTDPKGKAQKGSAIMIRAKSVKFVK